MQTSTPFSDIYEIFAFVRHFAPNATKLSNSQYNEQLFFYMLCVFCLYDIRRRKARAESDFGIKSVEIGALCPKKVGRAPKNWVTLPKKVGSIPEQMGHTPKKVGRRIPEQMGHTPKKSGATHSRTDGAHPNRWTHLKKKKNWPNERPIFLRLIKV